MGSGTETDSPKDIEMSTVNREKENCDLSVEISGFGSTDVVYELEDKPPWYLSIIFGMQHYLTMFSGAIAAPLLITSELCMENDNPAKGHIINSTLLVSGIATFLQATFGTRLPIIQGPSLAFLIPTLAILRLPKWEKCTPELFSNMTTDEKDNLWMDKVKEIQGGIILASSLEFLIGFTGVAGILMRWITPLSIVPTITLIGLSLFKESAQEASKHWGISIFAIVLLIVFSQYLGNVQIPMCRYGKDKGWHMKRFPFFKLFPVVLTIIFSWGLCGILTYTNVLPDDSEARTDNKLSALNKSPWIKTVYPGQFGMPTFAIGPALGVIAGVLASTVESIGDYYACAKLIGAPGIPIHAVNRGICMEGIGGILAGFCGTGSGLTSFSQNIGAIAITKVGSRRVIQFSALILIIFGLFGKLGALFISIPSPIMGAIFCVMFAIITGIGLSNLQYVNLNSARNLFVLGFSLFMGLSIPSYMKQNPHAINTGSQVADQLISILLNTSMFVGGFLGCLLDNTMPGSKEERGIIRWRAETNRNCDQEGTSDSYNLPIGMSVIKKCKFLKYLPVSPTYGI